MIIDANELRKKLKYVPKSCDKVFVSLIHHDESNVDEICFSFFSDTSKITFDFNIFEFDEEI